MEMPSRFLPHMTLDEVEEIKCAGGLGRRFGTHYRGGFCEEETHDMGLLQGWGRCLKT